MGEPTHRLDILFLFARCRLFTPAGLSEGRELQGEQAANSRTDRPWERKLPDLSRVCLGCWWEGDSSVRIRIPFPSVREKWIFLDGRQVKIYLKAVCDGPTFCRPNNNE